LYKKASIISKKISRELHLAFEPVNTFDAYESILKNTLNSDFLHFGTNISVFLSKFSAKKPTKKKRG
jgi:hypothetical protein